MTLICTVTGEQFDVSERERRLRARFGLPEPDIAPWARIRHLGAFWQHWALHRRNCSATGRGIISVYGSSCPYPVWAADEWLAHAAPPALAWDGTESVFGQMRRLFPTCPIPHTFGAGNENCAFADDWWYSKNCYLCHSGVNNEDVKYSYRLYGTKDSQYCAFVFDCEKCCDCVDCTGCYGAAHCLRCHNCSDSAFLYDCRNCSDCLFCWNLRNKQYCIENVQYSQEDYRQRRAGYDLLSYKAYEQARRRFSSELLSRAFHRAFLHENVEDSSGDYLRNCKGCEACFFAHDAEDCINCVRGGEGIRDSLDCVAFDLNIELACSTVFVSDRCYDVRFCAHITECQYLEYCMFCTKCSHCFGCCGLVGKQFHIFNKPYSKEEYHRLHAEIVLRMRENGEYGRFFPLSFAANPYDESWSAHHFPLTESEQRARGAHIAPPAPAYAGEDRASLEMIPDTAAAATPDLMKLSFRDDSSGRPFRILEDDVHFARGLGVPLSREYYLTRLRRLFGAIHYSGKQRRSACSRCKSTVLTLAPPLYERGLLCESCYLQVICA